MHKRENLAKVLARQEAMVGWKNPFMRTSHLNVGELTQIHMSMGLGHHLVRDLGSRNWQATKGGRRLSRA
jgi:hypothetical protein